MVCQQAGICCPDIADKPGLYGILERCGPDERVHSHFDAGQVALQRRYQHLPALAFVSRAGEFEVAGGIFGPDVAENLRHCPDCAHRYRSIGGADTGEAELCLGLIGGILQRLETLLYLLPLRLCYRLGIGQQAERLCRLGACRRSRLIGRCHELRTLALYVCQPLT